MSRYLESIYATLTSRFGYVPPGLTKIEILKNHQWFSGRTIGLPFVPTVGACTGRVVALASPKATRSPVQLGPGAHPRGDPRDHPAADRVQHPPLVHRGPGRRERGLPPAAGVEQDAARARPGPEAPEPRHHQPRLHPAQGARGPPDGLLPGAALCPLHAQAVRRRCPDQDAHGLPPRPHDRPRHRRVLPRREGRLREGLPGLPRRGDQDDPDPRQRGEAGEVLAAGADAQGEARRPRPERADGLRVLRPPQLHRGAAVRRQGARSSSRITRWPATSRRGCCSRSARTTPRWRCSSRRSTPRSPTSG